MDDHEQRIREKAFFLWLEEGRPDGQHERHWQVASELVANEDRQIDTSIPLAEIHGDEPAEPVAASAEVGERPDTSGAGAGASGASRLGASSPGGTTVPRQAGEHAPATPASGSMPAPGIGAASASRGEPKPQPKPQPAPAAPTSIWKRLGLGWIAGQ